MIEAEGMYTFVEVAAAAEHAAVGLEEDTNKEIVQH